MSRVLSNICFLFFVFCLQLVYSADRSELDVFVMEGAREIGSGSTDGHEEIFFVITAEYPAHNKINKASEILKRDGYKYCIPNMPEWQSYYDVKDRVVFDRQVVGIRENDNKIVFIVFSYEGLSLDFPSSTEMFVSVQRFGFPSKEDLENALKYLNVKCDY